MRFSGVTIRPFHVNCVCIACSTPRRRPKTKYRSCWPDNVDLDLPAVRRSKRTRGLAVYAHPAVDMIGSLRLPSRTYHRTNALAVLPLSYSPKTVARMHDALYGLGQDWLSGHMYMHMHNLNTDPYTILLQVISSMPKIVLKVHYWPHHDPPITTPAVSISHDLATQTHALEFLVFKTARAEEGVGGHIGGHVLYVSCIPNYYPCMMHALAPKPCTLNSTQALRSLNSKVTINTSQRTILPDSYCTSCDAHTMGQTTHPNYHYICFRRKRLHGRVSNSVSQYVWACRWTCLMYPVFRTIDPCTTAER